MKHLSHIAIPVLVAALLALASPPAFCANGVDKLMEQHPGVKDKKASAAGMASEMPSAPSDSRARNIYYEPPQTYTPPPNYPQPPQPAPPQQPIYPGGYIGLKYKIMLLGPNGYVREVPETYPFRSGMRFRLLFEPNVDGYLYIFHKGSNSKGSRLFPDPRINNGQRTVQRYQEVLIPYSGWFKFDAQTGVEDLYIFVSPQPLDTFDNLQYGQGGVLPTGGWEQVTAATSNYQYPRPDAARSTGGKKGDRNIVYEPGSPSYQPQTYTYTPPLVQPNNWDVNVPGSHYVVENAPMLIHHIRLQHHP